MQCVSAFKWVSIALMADSNSSNDLLVSFFRTYSQFPECFLEMTVSHPTYCPNRGDSTLVCVSTITSDDFASSDGMFQVENKL